MGLPALMQATVKLYLAFRVGRFTTADVDLLDPATVDHLIQRLAIPGDSVGLIMVNGRQGERDTPLSDGDTVALFPVVGGG
ncbi:MAG: MoaD/ThiS family protein [Acidobacteriota bacterium]